MQGVIPRLPLSVPRWKLHSLKLILNSASGPGGGGPLAANLTAAFGAPQLQPAAQVVSSGPELSAAVRGLAADANRVVIAAGGDGTVSAVAGALVGTDKVLGVIPTGTLNHFARDLTIPLELAAAVRVVKAGHLKPVDVGEVNGRKFLNNSSIGLYPSVVQQREQMPWYLPKWVRLVWSFLRLRRRALILDVALSAGADTIQRRTPFLFVGNNPYELEALKIGTRRSLETGRLGIFVAGAMGTPRLLQLGLRALAGRLDAAHDFDALCASQALLHARRHKVSVATDGEISRMTTPLRYRILPKALRVLVPPPGR